MQRARPSILDHFGTVPPKTLYHYTSLDVLLKIIATGKLWASNLRYLNDASEYAYSLRIFQNRVLRRYESVSESERAPLASLLEHLRHGMKRDAFTASFSARRDDLSQWRAYCPAGEGVSIGFDSKLLSENINAVHTEIPSGGLAAAGISVLAKVIYIDEDYGKVFDPLIEQACNGEYGDVFFGLDAPIMTFSVLRNVAPFYKNAAFKDEDEWRIVVGQSVISGKTQNVAFRVGKSTLIPYTEIDVRHGKPDFLSEIVVGPSPNIDLSIDAIRELLDLNGLATVEVKPSDVPYRHW